jgi:hypothetical protein
VDAEDFREADVLDCPLGCPAHWCKNCHRIIEKGKEHSCDGQKEFDELAREQKWKKCPGMLLCYSASPENTPNNSKTIPILIYMNRMWCYGPKGWRL